MEQIRNLTAVQNWIIAARMFQHTLIIFKMHCHLYHLKWCLQFIKKLIRKLNTTVLRQLQKVGTGRQQALQWSFILPYMRKTYQFYKMPH